MHKTKPARVADRWLAELARRASLQVYPPGVTLLRQGAVARDIYAVQHGLVKLTHSAHNGRECVFGLRTAGDWLGEAAALNPLMSVDFRSFSTQLEESLLRDRLMATLSAAFALLAVLLSAIGLYGVISYMVARRSNEIGLRMALGAGRGRVIGLVMRETALLLVAGVTVGLMLAYWASQSAANLLYGVKPTDPVTLVSAIAFLTITAAAASFAPARRAAALEPMKALRVE